MGAGSPIPATVLKSKICLVGERGAGKTSLLHRFVSGGPSVRQALTPLDETARCGTCCVWS